jgi:hypothetical protein
MPRRATVLVAVYVDMTTDPGSQLRDSEVNEGKKEF